MDASLKIRHEISTGVFVGGKTRIPTGALPYYPGRTSTRTAVSEIDSVLISIAKNCFTTSTFVIACEDSGIGLGEDNSRP